MGSDIRDPTVGELVPFQGYWYQEEGDLAASIKDRRIWANSGDLLGVIYWQISTGKLWASGHTLTIADNRQTIIWRRGNRPLRHWRRLPGPISLKDQFAMESDIKGQKDANETLNSIKGMVNLLEEGARQAS
mmetsp:Transcript_23418/g.35085  ORF Transcript_23418/g.35085 Transcript_23418/m.35085 type:complete len:132 (-) Transcript_23418:22-417(-)